MSEQRKYTTKLEGSRALIIGGTSGLGFAVAEACIEYGALVTISSSNKNRVQDTIEKLKKSYPSATDKLFGLTVDLSKADALEDELKKLLENSVKEMGQKLDHVVFTAGDALSILKLEDMVRLTAPPSEFQTQYPALQGFQSAQLTRLADYSERPSSRTGSFLRTAPTRKIPTKVPQ